MFRRYAALYIACTIALALTPGVASARSTKHRIAKGVTEERDSVGAYLQAGYVKAREYVADVPKVQAAGAAIVKKVTAECPHVLDGTSSDGGESAMEDEAAGAVFMAVEHSLASPSLKYVDTIAHLHWYRHRLATLVAAQATKERTDASLPEPNLCSDARAWANSGFKTVPATTSSFDSSFEAASNDGNTQSTITTLIAPKETGSDKTIAHKTDSLELKALPIVEELADGAKQLDEALGLPIPS